MKKFREAIIVSGLSIGGFLAGVSICYLMGSTRNITLEVLIELSLGFIVGYSIAALILAIYWLLNKVKSNGNEGIQIGSNTVIENMNIQQDENGLYITVPKGTKVEVKEV
jgi:hypothetical protein